MTEFKGTRTWVAATSLILAMLCGAVLSVVAGSISVTVLVVTLAAAPLLAWLASRYPAAALGLMVAAQPLAAFEVVTPIGSPSPSIILLALVLGTNATAIGLAYKTRPLFRTTAWVLALWIASYALRIQYEDVGLVVRQIITLSSFAAVMIAASALANERRVLSWTVAGAVVALSFLGVLGVLGSTGVIPMTSAGAAPRTLLGVLSPFTRNYGLNLPNDTLDVLFPLAVSGTLVGLFRKDSSWRLRLSSAVGLVAVSLAALLVFQSRSMLAQLGVALVVALWVTGLPLRKLLIVPALVLCAGAAQSILQSDPTASTLHLQSILGSIQAVLNDPLAYLTGQNENLLFMRQATQAGLAQAIGNDNAVHNLFLSNLIGGGYVAFLLICIAYFRPVVVLARETMRRPDRRDLQVLAVAAAAMLVSVSVEPVRAVVLGNWLVLGLMVGAEALQPRRESRLIDQMERPKAWPFSSADRSIQRSSRNPQVGP